MRLLKGTTYGWVTWVKLAIVFVLSATVLTGCGASPDASQLTADANSKWMLHLYDHGGAHFQKVVNGISYRWDAVTLKPIPHSTNPPWTLSKADFKAMAKDGVIDEVLRKKPNSLIRAATKEMGEQVEKQIAKRGAKSLSKRVLRELAETALKKVPVVLIIFYASDVQAGGFEYANKNAVIPGTLIEDVAAHGQTIVDQWIEKERKELEEARLENAGIDPSEREDFFPEVDNSGDYRRGPNYLYTTESGLFGSSRYVVTVENHISNSHVYITVHKGDSVWLRRTKVERQTYQGGVFTYSNSNITFTWNIQAANKPCSFEYSSTFSSLSASGNCPSI